MPGTPTVIPFPSPLPEPPRILSASILVLLCIVISEVQFCRCPVLICCVSGPFRFPRSPKRSLVAVLTCCDTVPVFTAAGMHSYVEQVSFLPMYDGETRRAGGERRPTRMRLVGGGLAVLATAALVLSAFSERSGDQATELGPKFVLCRLFLLFLAVLALCVNLSDTVPSTAVADALAKADGLAEKNLSPVPEDLLREAQQAAEEQRAMPGVQVRSQQMTLRGDGDAMLSAATVVQSSAYRPPHSRGGGRYCDTLRISRHIVRDWGRGRASRRTGLREGTALRAVLREGMRAGRQRRSSRWRNLPRRRL
eukprot:990204-Rhodomonas_salina.2